jgi:ABC-type transport system substrate-binding protein
VAATLSRVPPERGTDLEYIATFPSFYIVTRINDADGLSGFTSSHTMLASNRYRAPSPQNYSRYMNPELDGLIARYFRTIPMDQRADLMRQIVRSMTDQLVVLPLWYSSNSGARDNRLTGVGPQWPNASFAWNAYAWDVTS